MSGQVAVHHPGQVQVDRLARVGDADRGYQAVDQQHRVVRGDVVDLAEEDDLGGGEQTVRSRGAQAEIEGRDADRIEVRRQRGRGERGERPRRIARRDRVEGFLRLHPGCFRVARRHSVGRVAE